MNWVVTYDGQPFYCVTRTEARDFVARFRRAGWTGRFIITKTNPEA